MVSLCEIYSGDIEVVAQAALDGDQTTLEVILNDGSVVKAVRLWILLKAAANQQSMNVTELHRLAYDIETKFGNPFGVSSFEESARWGGMVSSGNANNVVQLMLSNEPIQVLPVALHLWCSADASVFKTLSTSLEKVMRDPNYRGEE